MRRGTRFGALLIEGLEEAIAYHRGELQARTHVVESQEAQARGQRDSDAVGAIYPPRRHVPASRTSPSR